MSEQTAHLLQRFEALPAGEKQEFALEVLRRARAMPLDSGPLTDEEIGEAAIALAGILDREEDAPSQR
ncbi:MAG TPA: hypothetical protein VGR73_06780 [Bryobacteraceae bacterium]|nr:hypothetical protein [Bryobacteraceae bacterium]